MTNFDPEWGFSTIGVRAGQQRTAEQEHADPIFATSSFVFASAEEAAARFSGEQAGNIYSRFTNPTVRTFQDRLAALEGGESCVATASGMAAISATFTALLKAGDHVVCSASVFGSVIPLLNNYYQKFGVETSYVELSNIEAWEAAIKPNTKMFFLESPSNPLTELADVRALSALAKKHDIILVVDNCFCTPVLQRPLELGADVVVHSATKYLDGQGRCLGGAVVGDSELVGKEVFGVLRTAGAALSPFNAWVFVKGLETLELRMKAHSENALQLAQWLEAHPGIERVYYPGISSHPQHELAKQQMSAFGGIVAIEVKGGRDEAWHLVNSTQMISITANLGDVKSTVTHPATTTHGRLTDEERATAGVKDNLLRLSVGIENIEDLKADLERGLAS